MKRDTTSLIGLAVLLVGIFVWQSGWRPGVLAPAGPRVFFVAHETGDDDAAFASMKTASRKDEFAKPLAAKGHILFILDKDQVKHLEPKDGWKSLPAVVVTTDGKAVVAIEPLPAVSLAEVAKIIEKHGGPLK